MLDTSLKTEGKKKNHKDVKIKRCCATISENMLWFLFRDFLRKLNVFASKETCLSFWQQLWGRVYQCRVEVIFAPLVSEEYLSHDSILMPLSNRKALR